VFSKNILLIDIVKERIDSGGDDSSSENSSSRRGFMTSLPINEENKSDDRAEEHQNIEEDRKVAATKRSVFGPGH
jgi:hypothetical protein